MLDQLNGRLFLADDIAAATGVGGQALTNLLTRSTLSLVSEPSGRGRSRLFPLIDVYQIAITGKLTKASGSQAWAAAAADYMLHGIGGNLESYEGADAETLKRIIGAMRGAAISADEWERGKLQVRDMLGNIAKDIFQAEPEYWKRDEASPYYLVAELAYEGEYTFGNSNFKAPLITRKPVGLTDGIYICGIILNITLLLNGVDRILLTRSNRSSA